MKVFVHSEVTKKNDCEKMTWKIEDAVLELGSAIARHILFINAWAGCDTTYAIYKQGTLYFNSTV